DSLDSGGLCRCLRIFCTTLLASASSGRSPSRKSQLACQAATHHGVEIERVDGKRKAGKSKLGFLTAAGGGRRRLGMKV
ncbi:hypothetical protein THAOC_35782, partial [Thalassiosira oceanica]